MAFTEGGRNERLAKMVRVLWLARHRGDRPGDLEALAMKISPHPTTAKDALAELAAVVESIELERLPVTDPRRWRLFCSFVVAARRELEASTRLPAKRPFPASAFAGDAEL